MEKIWLPFNVNETVKVKLTEEGRTFLNEQHAANMARVSRKGVILPNVPAFVLDEEGYWHVQLWELMSKLGSKCSLGAAIPFDTQIFFSVRNDG